METAAFTRLPTKPHQQIILILLLGVVILGSGIGLRDPWPADEPRFALIARDMVDSGEWFFPRRGGELYPDKPPLFMWSQALMYQLTGSLRIAFLLPNLIASLLTLCLVYDAGRRLWRPRVGLMASLFLLVTPQFVLQAKAGQIDAMVAFWVAMGVYGFLRHLLQGPDWKWLYLGFAACGFGIITKGVGFLPILLFIPWLWARRRGHARSLAPGSLWPHVLFGPLLMLAAVALWLVPMLIQVELADDPAFAAYRDNILIKQTGERYAAPSHHFKPFWYYLTNVVTALWLPVFLLLPWAVPAWRRRITRGDARYSLLIGWVVLVILFFSISPAKRGVYLLPALPWACLAMAPLLDGLLQRLGVRRLALGVVGLVGLLTTLAGVDLLWIHPEKNLDLIDRYQVDLAAAVFFVGLLIVFLSLSLRRSPALAYASMMAVAWLTYGLWVWPTFNGFKSGRALMLRVEQRLAPETPLALVDWKEQTLLQAQRPVENFGFLVPLEDQARAGVAWLGRHPDGYLLVQGRAMLPCFAEQRADYLGVAHRRDWYLVGSEGITEACR
jgi:4-amino-4-deoxy-L-arabinose transferase-like glycosyltransferase